MSLRPLPRSLVPLPEESLTGFMLRLAHRLDQSPGEIAVRTGLSRKVAVSSARHLVMLDAGYREDFAAATRLSVGEADGLTLRPQVHCYPPLTDAVSGSDARTLRPKGFFPPWVLGSRTRYCPHCLRGDGSEVQERHGGPWRIHWRLAVVFACLKHHVFLSDICAKCGLPAHSGHPDGPLRLLIAPAGRGLHPTQCRNGLPWRARELCKNPLAVSHDSTGSQTLRIPSHQVLELQQNILGCLAPDGVTTHARRAFSDLHAMAAIVRATWPAAATVTPEYALVTALDQCIAGEASRSQSGMPILQPSNVWATPPLSAPATAALLDISARLLSLPSSALQQALGLLLSQAPPPMSRGWGKTWSLIRRDCSPALRTLIKLQGGRGKSGPDSHGATSEQPGASGCGFRTSRIAPPSIQVRYRPETVPQWLPDEWFAAIPWASRQAMSRACTLRRSAAVRLVQLATGMDLGAAADYLGIPASWHSANVTQPKLPGHWSYHYSTEALREAFSRLVSSAPAASEAADYRARRLRYMGWTLNVRDWEMILVRVSEQEAGMQPSRSILLPLDESLRDVASIFVWARVTGSEWCLAPTINAPESCLERRLTESEKRRLQMINRSASRRGRLLQEALTDFAATLCAR